MELSSDSVMETEPGSLVGLLPLSIWTQYFRLGHSGVDGERGAAQVNQVMPWRFIFL